MASSSAPQPEAVHLWIPRRDEHELAASLGMCEKDPDLLEKLVRAAQDDLARTMPGVPVRVHRWHVWRVVRAIHRAGFTNTPDGRAAAYGMLAGGNDDE